MKKKYLIGIIGILLIPIILYAAKPIDPLVKLLNLFTEALNNQIVILEEIRDNTVKDFKFGGEASRSFRTISQSSASSTPTFFATPSTASSTLLTLGCNGNRLSATSTIVDIEELGLYVQATASTTANTVITIYPEVSNDCIDWYGMSYLYDQVTTTGSNVGVFYAAATGTIINWTTGAASTIPYKTQFTLKNLASKAIRFSADTSTTSEVWLQATEVVRNTFR